MAVQRNNHFGKEQRLRVEDRPLKLDARLIGTVKTQYVIVLDKSLKINSSFHVLDGQH